MPSPTAGDRYVKPLLTNVAVKWLQENASFISNSIFPNIPVKLQGGQYAKYRREDFFRNPGNAARRGLSEESKGTKFSTDFGTYFAHPYAWHKDIDDQERANSMNPFDPDEEASEIVAQQMMILREVEFIDSYFKTGVWGTDLAGKSTSPSSGEFLQFDQDGSDPVQTIDNLKTEIGRTGFIPNILAVDYETHQALRHNKAILDRIKYGGGPANPAVVTAQALASIFEVDKYVVGRAVYTTSADGAENPTTDYIMPKGALLAYAPDRPSLQRPSAGYTVSWTGLVGGGNEFGIRIRQFRMEHLKSDRTEGEMAYDMHKVAPDLAAFLSDTVA